MTKWIRVTVGTILTLVGLVWLGQGLNVLPGSSMTGDMKWAYIGAAVLVIGLVLTVGGLRNRKPPAA